MPYYDEDGQEVQGVLSPEESEAKVKEASDKAAADAKTESDRIVAEKEVELAKLRAQEKNWKDLRQGKTEAEIEAEKLATQMQEVEKRNDEKIQSVEQKRLSEIRDDEIAKLAGGDEEMKKKLLLSYDTDVAGDTSTKAGIQERALKAYRLVTSANVQPGIMTGDALSAAGGGSVLSGSGGPVLDGTYDLGKRMGLSKETIDKYSKNIQTTTK